MGGCGYGWMRVGLRVSVGWVHVRVSVGWVGVGMGGCVWVCV